VIYREKKRPKAQRLGRVMTCPGGVCTSTFRLYRLILRPLETETSTDSKYPIPFRRLRYLHWVVQGIATPVRSVPEGRRTSGHQIYQARTVILSCYSHQFTTFLTSSCLATTEDARDIPLPDHLGHERLYTATFSRRAATSDSSIGKVCASFPARVVFCGSTSKACQTFSCSSECAHQVF
jgi:hypothetical protein